MRRCHGCRPQHSLPDALQRVLIQQFLQRASAVTPTTANGECVQRGTLVASRVEVEFWRFRTAGTGGVDGARMRPTVPIHVRHVAGFTDCDITHRDQYRGAATCRALRRALSRADFLFAAPSPHSPAFRAEKPRREALCLEFRRGRTVSLDRRQPETIRRAQAASEAVASQSWVRVANRDREYRGPRNTPGPNPEWHRLRRGRWPVSEGMVRLAVILRRPPHGH